MLSEGSWMTLLKNRLVPWDQTILHVSKTSTKGRRNSRAVALVVKINSSNNAVLITYPEVSSHFVSLIKCLSAISAKHLLILSYFVLLYSTEYPLIFFTCYSNSISCGYCVTFTNLVLSLLQCFQK